MGCYCERSVASSVYQPCPVDSTTTKRGLTLNTTPTCHSKSNLKRSPPLLWPHPLCQSKESIKSAQTHTHTHTSMTIPRGQYKENQQRLPPYYDHPLCHSNENLKGIPLNTTPPAHGQYKENLKRIPLITTPIPSLPKDSPV